MRGTRIARPTYTGSTRGGSRYVRFGYEPPLTIRLSMTSRVAAVVDFASSCGAVGTLCLRGTLRSLPARNGKLNTGSRTAPT